MSDRKRGRRLLAMTLSTLLAGAGIVGVGAVAANAAEAEADPSQTTLSWGIKESFRNYINGPIANGSITLGGNVTDSPTPFQFSQGVGTVDTETGAANVTFNGSVHFQGHNGILDLKFENVRINTAENVLYTDVTGLEFVGITEPGPEFTYTDVALANLTGVSWDGNTYTAAAAELTEVGSQAFGGFYQPGDAIDGLSLTVVPQEAEPEPATVSASVTNADETGLAISAAITGVVPSDSLPNGVHVGLIPSDLDSAERADFRGVTSVATLPADGVFDANFDAAADGLDRSSSYDVVVWPQRQNVTPDNTIARTQLAVTEEQWNAVFPPEEPQPQEPSVTFEVTEVADERVDISISGTGFGDVQAHPGQATPQVYFMLIERGSDLSNISETATAISASVDEDGNLSHVLPVPATDLDATKEYELISWPSRSFPSEETLYTRDDVTIDWAALFPGEQPEPQEPSVSVEVTEVANERADIWITGTGFGDVPVLIGQTEPHVYFILIERGSDPADVSDTESAISAAVDEDGNLSELLSVSAADLDPTKEYELISWPSRSFPSNSNLYTRDDVTIDWEALFPAEEVTEGWQLIWGVKESFRNYVGGPIANGTISFNGVEQDRGDVFSWENGEVLNAENPLEVQFEGTATFEGHGGILFVEISDPRVVVNADGSGSIYADVSSKDFIDTATEGELVEYPNVELVSFTSGEWQGTDSAPGSLAYAVTADAGTFTVDSTELTEAGAPAFGGFYGAGEGFDGFTLNGAETTDPELTEVVAQAPTRSGNVVTIPSVEGVIYSDGSGDELSGSVTLTEGQTLAVSASADEGYVLTDGTHSWSFEYEAPAGPPNPDTAFDWQLIWGVKESFRSYVVGPIANGTITTSGNVSQASSNGQFSWTDGEDLDENNPGSEIQFNGTVTFSGHGGILFIEISDPRVVVNANGSGSIYADVSSKEFIDTTTEGELIEYGEVELVTFSAGTWSGGDEPSFNGPNVVLADEGAAAFGGFYEAGEAFDNFTLNSVEQSVPGGGNGGNNGGNQNGGQNNTGGGNNTGGDSETCVAYEVSGNLDWALKDSFLSYIQGGIAQGEVNVSGVEFSGDSFRWSGSGQLNTNDMLGDVSFPGTVHFTGHDGVLDTKISNVRLVIHSASQASIYANVVSNDMDGNSHDLSNVRFANVNISGSSLTADSFSVSGAATTLTADGAKAFAGFYESGEELAPVSFSLSLGNEVPCSAAVNPSGEGLAQTGLASPILALLAAAMVLMALGARSVTVAQRRRI